MDTKQVKVLIVEDEVMIAMQLTSMLQTFGYQVIQSAATGEAALESARTDPPDVAIVDIRLPGKMDGFETAKEIAAFCDTAFIFTSGHAIQKLMAEEDTKKLKILAMMEKPYSALKINEAIDKAFPDKSD